MRTISQVAKLTGVSTRTLQYYDEIGLLKPSSLTQSGYRLYNDEALKTLQQILFFKEQKKLLLLKRNRINRLIELLARLEQGETCMSFKEFDLSRIGNI